MKHFQRFMKHGYWVNIGLYTHTKQKDKPRTKIFGERRDIKVRGSQIHCNAVTHQPQLVMPAIMARHQYLFDTRCGKTYGGCHLNYLPP